MWRTFLDLQDCRRLIPAGFAAVPGGFDWGLVRDKYALWGEVLDLPKLTRWLHYGLSLCMRTLSEIEVEQLRREARKRKRTHGRR